MSRAPPLPLIPPELPSHPRGPIREEAEAVACREAPQVEPGQRFRVRHRAGAVRVSPGYKLTDVFGPQRNALKVHHPGESLIQNLRLEGGGVYRGAGAGFR